MPNKQKQPTYVSLFSGCGGLDLGFHEAGFRGLLSCDIDEAALTTLNKNTGSPTQKIDLSKATPKLPKRFDVLLSGSPCQGFSTIGLRNLDDPRNSLIYKAAEIARENKPKVVVIENVPGVLVGLHKIYWQGLIEQLEAAGYKTRQFNINCADYGVPQSRRRVLLLAWRTKKELKTSPKKRAAMSLGDALKNIDDASDHAPCPLHKNSVDYRISKQITVGQKLTNARGGPNAVHTWNIPGVFGKINTAEKELLEDLVLLRRRIRRRDFGDADPVDKHIILERHNETVIQSLIEKKYIKQVGDFIDLTNTFNGKYRRLDPSKPSRTVDTRFGDPKLFLHPTEHRGFTVREAARLQCFPDHFIFEGTTAQKYRMIGNAVPPPIAKILAELASQLI